MTLRAFRAAVVEHHDLEWLGAYEDDHVGVRNARTDCWWGIPASEIGEHSWEEFAAIFEGKRSCRVMTQIARIVGYYSFKHVWNKSKQAEAKDRAKGNYGVPEAA